ncbi:hypothetical protein [Crateriforma spongiae]|uniref:hypothetical protein n=1 Tax=Crateriforma spongiae TaxID=2724528 RepID=UPI001446A7F4|nr:hypothetical protein [Crateriforma spongiae]
MKQARKRRKPEQIAEGEAMLTTTHRLGVSYLLDKLINVCVTVVVCIALVLGSIVAVFFDGFLIDRQYKKLDEAEKNRSDATKRRLDKKLKKACQ